jgi:hypothetical protein
VVDWAKKMKAFAPPPGTNFKPDFHAGAMETHALGSSAGYGALGSDPELSSRALDSSYADAAKELACKRICLAAYRLTELLNELYPRDP